MRVDPTIGHRKITKQYTCSDVNIKSKNCPVHMWNGCAICMWHPNAVTFHTKIKHLNIVYRRAATITMTGRIMICVVNNCQYFLRWFHKVSRTKGLFRKIMFFMLKGLLCTVYIVRVQPLHFCYQDLKTKKNVMF